MKRVIAFALVAALSSTALAATNPLTVPTKLEPKWQAKTRDVFKQAIEIPSVHHRNEMPRMAKLLADQFRAAGIPESDIRPRENVFTYHAWRALGRQVRRESTGSKSSRSFRWGAATGPTPRTARTPNASARTSAAPLPGTARTSGGSPGPARCGPSGPAPPER